MLFLLACTSQKSTDPPRRDDTAPIDAHESGATDTNETTTHDSGTVGEQPPLVIVVMADDLGDNMYWAMEDTASRLDPAGRRFTRAYTTVPNCCPARTSFFSNAYPSETGIQGNAEPSGGFARYDDTTTLATRLQEVGVTTAIYGKYLNGYETDQTLYVPPGWDSFNVPTDLGDFTDTTVFQGSSTATAAGTATPGDTGGTYLLEWLFDSALTFLDEHPDEPTFLLLTPQSPHAEGTPAPEDQGTWEGYEWRPKSFAEDDVSDKPAFIQEHEVTPEDVVDWDARTVLMMENLQSLDREMAAFYDGLQARGLLDRATLVFTSDNGMLHGEHRAEDKGLPYEEAVRVPLVVVQPGLAAGDDDRLVAINLDIGALVLDLLGVPGLATDEGESLQTLLDDPDAPGRDRVFLESALAGHPVWAGVVTDRFKYVELSTGESELYDVTVDPYELDSMHANPPNNTDMDTLGEWVDEHRSLVITTSWLPAATSGQEYEETLTSWGGHGTLTWTVEDGSLPDGFELSTDGVLSGRGRSPGNWSFTVRVTDSETSPLTGAAYSHAANFTLSVDHQEAVARRSGETVQFQVPAHPGARVAVSVTGDGSADTPPKRSEAKVSGRQPVELQMRLDPGRTWHWRTEIDGVAVEGGVLKAK